MNFHLRFIVMRCFNIANCSGAALAAAGFLLGFTMSAAPAAADPKEVGVWYDDTGKGAVKIEICTPTTLCGKIYWLKEPMADDGHPKIDRFNPEPSMRNQKHFLTRIHGIALPYAHAAQGSPHEIMMRAVEFLEIQATPS